MIAANESNEKKEQPLGRTRLQKLFISIGIICYFLSIFLLLNTVFLNPYSFEYFLSTIGAGIIFGGALFFEGYGYYLIGKIDESRLSYFGSVTLFQVMRIIYRIPYVLLCYNAFMIVGEINLELIFLYVLCYLPFVLSRLSWRWIKLQNWLKNLDQQF
ncbi:MAG: hypothetical protein EAX86_12635 [Candidatus Heimdallarchaeota archaeon]|nr:hypothetical protein [Candidatus Heimdallarchaeota archaeon]